MATLTLTRMAEGGMYDQLGGGFSRYSVDQFWMIPHFEKMLYDNGALLATYADAALATGDALFRRIAAETGAWMLREMQDASPDQTGGGFYSAYDADSEGHEGKFYVWTRTEAHAALTPLEWNLFSRRFGFDEAPNFEGAWHAHVFVSIEQIAKEQKLEPAEVEKHIDSARAKLLAVRSKRVWPGLDDKVLGSWNALAIRGLAKAAGVNIPSAWNTGDTATATLSGSSMAAPHAAGVAARYLQFNNAATPAQVERALVTTGTPGTPPVTRILYWPPSL